MGSRKPVPTTIKRLRGNPGRRRLPKPGEEPEPVQLDALPEAPDFLGEAGRIEWERVGPFLVQQRVMTEADVTTFAAYCAAIDLMVESKRDIQKNGHTIRGDRGGEVRNPALAAFAQSVNTLKSLAGEFGLTPSSRARMRLPTDDGESLADLMAGDSEDDVS